MVKNLKEVLTVINMHASKKQKHLMTSRSYLHTRGSVQREKQKSKEKKHGNSQQRMYAILLLPLHGNLSGMRKQLSLPEKHLSPCLTTKRGNPLWEQESTKAVKNTITTYSKYSVDYPYLSNICSCCVSRNGIPNDLFQFCRPKKDGTYTINLNGNDRSDCA